MEKGTRFSERAHEHQRYLEQLKKREGTKEGWQFMRGDYSFVFRDAPRATPDRYRGLIGYIRKLIEPRSMQRERHRPEELLGTEQVLADEIKKKLKERNETSSDRPVVLLDFGGMLSVSMVRIAHALRQEVALGCVVIVSSSLEFDPDVFLKQKNQSLVSLTFHDDMDTEKFYKEQRDLVHYVHGDVSTLRDVVITLPNGTPMKLNKQIDVLHESSALIHGWKNEIDIPRLGSLLANGGLLFLGSSEQSVNDSLPMRQERREATSLGIKNLAEVGMVIKDDLTVDAKGGYVVFQKEE